LSEASLEAVVKEGMIKEMGICDNRGTGDWAGDRKYLSRRGGVKIHC
jgi:hypothetical protein